MAVIGLDLGGTKLASALFTEEGNILHRATDPLSGREGSGVGALIREAVMNVQEIANDKEVTIEGIGVSVPGIYSGSTGKVWAPNIPGWEDYPLLQELRMAVEDEFPVRIDSDRACYILGEVWKGHARGCRDAIFIAVGTGIGAGILVDGKILRGANDIAGATGWMALDRPYHEKYASCGCFEYQASGEGLVRMAREGIESGRESVLSRMDPSSLSGKEVFQAYSDGDTLAKEVVVNAVQCWGMAAANFVSLFNPEMIIFGGGVFGPAAGLLDRIVAEAGKWAQPISIGKVEMTVSALGQDAGLYGTGRLAFGGADR